MVRRGARANSAIRIASLPRRFTDNRSRASAIPDRLTVRASSNTLRLTCPQAYGNAADPSANVPNRPSVLPTPRNAALTPALTSAIGHVSSNTTEPVDRATLRTRNVAPTGLTEYAFGSNSCAHSGAAVTGATHASAITVVGDPGRAARVVVRGS